MTKAELIEEVSRAAEITRKESEVIVEAIFDSVAHALRAGIGSNFGTRQRRPRMGRNPKTGALVEVPAKHVAYFKPSKELKALVNSESTEKKSVPAESPDR